MATEKRIRDLNQGALFTRYDREGSPIWVRGEYCKQNGKYSIYRYEDVSHETFIKGNVKIFEV